MPNQIEERREKEIYDEERWRKEREKDGQEEKKKEAKPESKPIAKEKMTLPEKVQIPVVELDKPVIDLKEIKVEKEIPEIREEEVKITIPIIELEEPNIELKQTKLDYTLPDIIPEERRLEIPVIRLERPKRITCIITTFDERLPQVKVPNRPKRLKIPIYRASKPVIREVVSSFDSRIDEQILRNLIIEDEKGEIIEKKLIAEINSPSGERSGGGEEFEEVPDIVDFVFGVSDSKISSERPKLILYKELENDRTIESFETLCIRIYREIEGGKPEFKPIEKLDDFNKREIEKWLEPDRKLIVVDLDKAENGKKAVKDWFSRQNLGETLRRTAVGGTGFLIFKTRDSDLYDHCVGVIEELLEEYRNLDILYVKPKKLEKETKKKLASLMWGNLRFKESEFSGIIDFDDIFNIFKREFERRLKSLEKEGEGLYVFATNQYEGEESREHFMMKCFIVKFLSRERKLDELTKIKEIIKTEEEYEGVIPDIRVSSSVYEVETLFAEDREGKLPKKKIEHSITKYQNTDIREINIVLDNLTFLRHLKDLVEIKNVLKNLAKKYGKTIRFYTLDVQNAKLLSLDDVRKKISSLYDKVYKRTID